MQAIIIFCIFAVMKTNDAITLYLQYAATQRRMSQLTLKAYREELERFAQYLHSMGIDNVEDITTREPRQWQASLMQDGSAPRSVLRMLSALRGWQKYLRRCGIIKNDFMAKVSSPKVPQTQPVFFKEREVERIYDIDIFPDTFNGRRDRLLLRLLYETGIRRSEAAGLRLSAIDFSARTIKVLGKRSKERYIPVNDELLKAISDFVEARSSIACQDDHLLVSENGKPVSDSQIYTIVRRYMSALSNADRVSPHVFRHSFATHILNEGGNIDAIKHLLGHSSLDATEIYTHVTREHLRQTYRQAHPRALEK